MSAIDRRERAHDVACRLGRQMAGQHVLVPYNGTIYCAQLSFETGVGPFVITRALSLYLDCFSDMCLTCGMSFFHSILRLPDKKNFSGVAGRQQSKACQMRLEHQGPYLQPADLRGFLGAPGDVSDEIRNLAEEASHMSQASQPFQTQQ